MKASFTLLFSFITLISFAQITLEHTYLTGDTTTLHPITLSLSGDKYYLVDTSHNIQIYNLDHTLWKTILTTNYKSYPSPYVTAISENLFNTAGNVALYLSVPADDFNYGDSGVVMDENGNILLSVFNGGTAQAINTTAGAKLIVDILDSNGFPVGSSVYSLPGMVQGIKPVAGGGTENISARVFPNPTGGQLNIATNIPEDDNKATLSIYNDRGQYITGQSIVTGMTTSVISTNTLSKGVYQYKIETGNGAHTEGSFVIQ